MGQQGDGVIGIGTVVVGVACSIRENPRCNRDDFVGVAVGVWCVGGGVNGAGDGGPVGKGSTGNGGISLNEIGSSL